MEEWELLRCGKAGGKGLLGDGDAAAEHEEEECDYSGVLILQLAEMGGLSCEGFRRENVAWYGKRCNELMV